MNRFLILLLLSICSGLLVSCAKTDPNPATTTTPPASTTTPPASTTTAFTPKDEIIGSNFFQVEFSTDFRSMVWCEQIVGSGGRANLYYADVDLVTGLPDLTKKQLVDVIKGNGWPYWGHDKQGRFFMIMNEKNEIKIVRRNQTNTLVTTNLGSVNKDVKSLLNVSSDSTKSYCWVNYVISSAGIGQSGTGRDSLFAFRSDNPARKFFIASEVRNTGGGAYELTFPRWMANSEVLAYPFRPNPAQPYWDMKFWDGTTQTSTQVTNDVARSILNHHVDDLPFTVPGQTGNTYLASVKGARTLAIYRRTGNSSLFSEIESYPTPTTLNGTLILTSFEPFTINGKTYGAFQLYETTGGAIPGNALGEIWLRGVLGETGLTKISTINGVAVDPEYVIGKNKVWIYYYGKPLGQNVFDLHRCETPLTR